MWSIKHYVLQLLSKQNSTITFNTVRAIRLGALAWSLWESAHQFPAVLNYLCSTDIALLSMCIKGMKQQLGTKFTPSMALRHCHVWYNQQRREEGYFSDCALFPEQYN